MLDRREAVKVLLRARGDALVVCGLGSPTYDVAAAGDDPRNFYLWGAMGGAAMIGLGLALAQPARRVLVLTGDGDMLMGLGALATIAVQRPPNLAVAVLDNAAYGETGMQASHTVITNLAAVARACGIPIAVEVENAGGLEQLAGQIFTAPETLFANVRIAATEETRVLPERDGVVLKRRFRAALGL